MEKGLYYATKVIRAAVDNFIEQAWAGEQWLIDHLKGKFNGYYEDYGPRGVMNTFYCNLDGANKQKLMAWVMDNFNDEQKLRFKD